GRPERKKRKEGGVREGVRSAVCWCANEGGLEWRGRSGGCRFGVNGGFRSLVWRWSFPVAGRQGNDEEEEQRVARVMLVACSGEAGEDEEGCRRHWFSGNERR
ncbi:hypothetical protein HAX54_015543, partial [Datura stramonium]|nr:hypothetical protein [Datura stramonium]